MENKKSFLNFFFSPSKSWLIIILLLLFNVITIAQDSPPEEFPVGAYFNKQTRTVQEYYDKFDSTGMDWIVQYAGNNTQGFVEPYSVMADNADAATDFIMYYSTSWYSKWEAEENQQDNNKVGVKHTDGQIAEWEGDSCWSSIGIPTATNKIVFGPHYHQEKYYKRWWYETVEERYTRLKYIPRFRMALAVNDQVGQEEAVCNLYVVVRHSWVENNQGGPNVDDTLKGPITLYVSDFPPDSSFKDFYLVEGTNSYQYPTEFRDSPYDNKRVLPENLNGYWRDIYGNQGVQFCIDWLRNDNKCTLYIDYVEVYDLEGWSGYLENDSIVINNIQTYAQNFSDWSNLKYWMGHGEPFSLDAYTPIKTVDAIVKSAFTGAPPLMTVIYPYWETKINEDIQLERYYNTVQPEKLMIDFYPFLAGYTSARYEDWYWFQKQLQISSTLQPGFYYWAQAFGYHQGNNWLVWRQPNANELKAQTMFALAHGVKGIIYMAFDAYPMWEPGYGSYIHEGIIDTNKNPTDLFFVLKDNIVPRLKGTLGNTLLNLDYTGGFVQIVQPPPPPPDDDIPSFLDYLALSSDDPFYHFHAGLLKRKNMVDDKYFLLVNLNTEYNRFVTFTVTNNFGVNNLRIKYVEDPSILDLTIQDEYSYELPMPPGEGYLFEVAPVVKYGGKLIYDETISNPTTLHDEMTIKNGKTLTVNSTYNVYADIRIKEGGRIVTTGNGKINFYQGHKLIVEGNAILNGTVSNKLKLDFTNPVNSNGIIIKPGGSLTISYCEIKNAVKGITSELNLYNLNILNVDFIDCDSVAVYIVGRNRLLEELTLTPPPPQIKNCNITNSDFGILVSNLSQIVIQQNTLTGTDLAISLSNVTTPSIINNTLTGTSEMPGIFLESCNGVVRGNSIIGFSNGLTLGHSSPDIGGNTIEHNWNRGIYVGVGSVPNLRGKLVKAPICVSGMQYQVIIK